MFLTLALFCNWLWHPWAAGFKGHCYSPCLSVCGAVHNLSKVRLFMHCMYLLWTHTCLIIKSEQNVPLSQHTHSCTTSPSLLSLPKSTPYGDVVMSDPLSQCAHCRWFRPPHCCRHGYFLRFPWETEDVCCSSVCHTCSIYPRAEKGQGCWRNTLFLAFLNFRPARLRDRLWSFAGSVAAVCFMGLLLFCLIFVVVAEQDVSALVVSKASWGRRALWFPLNVCVC